MTVNEVSVELKSVSELLPIYAAQLKDGIRGKVMK